MTYQIRSIDGQLIEQCDQLRAAFAQCEAWKLQAFEVWDVARPNHPKLVAVVCEEGIDDSAYVAMVASGPNSRGLGLGDAWRVPDRYMSRR